MDAVLAGWYGDCYTGYADARVLPCDTIKRLRNFGQTDGRWSRYNRRWKGGWCHNQGNACTSELFRSSGGSVSWPFDILPKVHSISTPTWYLIPCPHSQNIRCFTLMTLASSAANVAIIKSHSMAKLSLELALENHGREVGAIISPLWRCLRFVWSAVRTIPKKLLDRSIWVS